MNCPKCNTELDPGAKFCTECGTPVRQEPLEAQPQTQPQPGTVPPQGYAPPPYGIPPQGYVPQPGYGVPPQGYAQPPYGIPPQGYAPQPGYGIPPQGYAQPPVFGSIAGPRKALPYKMMKRLVFIIIGVIVLLPFLAAGIYGFAKADEWDRQNARSGCDSSLDNSFLNGMCGFLSGIDYYIFQCNVFKDPDEIASFEWSAADNKAKWTIGRNAAEEKRRQRLKDDALQAVERGLRGY